MRTRHLWLLALLAGLVATLTAAERQSFVGEVTNTTHGVTAPIRFELEWEGDEIRGFIEVQEPLQPGRWPVHGRRRGAWYEFSASQVENTQTAFRGVMGPAKVLRGTYVFGGGGRFVEYGHFWSRLSTEPPDHPPR